MQDFNNIANVLDVLCPMHVILNKTGHMAHCGPTVHRLWADDVPPKSRFLDEFEVLRPRGICDMTRLLAAAGQKLHLKKRSEPYTTLKGVLMPNVDTGGAILNLSFGISIIDGVRDYALTSADFAATDLTIEMLYLVEAKSAAMEASRKLNLRLQGARIAAEEQAFTDTLTGLKNRRAIDHIMSRLIERTFPFALMQLDLDYFKAVNDTYGHAAGDAVLQQVARVLVEETRENDCVARVGGDEFVLIFEALTNRPKLADISRRIISRIEEPVPFNGDECRISCSVGIALSHDCQPLSQDNVMSDADEALYACKRAGRAQFRFFGDPTPVTAVESPVPRSPSDPFAPGV